MTVACAGSQRGEEVERMEPACVEHKGLRAVCWNVKRVPREARDKKEWFQFLERGGFSGGALN